MGSKTTGRHGPGASRDRLDAGHPVQPRTAPRSDCNRAREREKGTGKQASNKTKIGRRDKTETKICVINKT
jgi:hypothetical protein